MASVAPLLPFTVELGILSLRDSPSISIDLPIALCTTDGYVVFFRVKDSAEGHTEDFPFKEYLILGCNLVVQIVPILLAWAYVISSHANQHYLFIFEL